MVGVEGKSKGKTSTAMNKKGKEKESQSFLFLACAFPFCSFLFGRAVFFLLSLFLFPTACSD